MKEKLIEEVKKYGMDAQIVGDRLVIYTNGNTKTDCYLLNVLLYGNVYGSDRIQEPV